MNILTAAAVYKGVVPNPFNSNGEPLMHFEMPANPKSKKDIPIPLLVLSGYQCPKTIPGSFEKGTNVLINGRMYPNKQTGDLYVVPIEDFQELPKDIYINQVFLSGGCGYVFNKYIPKLDREVTEFGIMGKSANEPRVFYSRKHNDLEFPLESYRNDALRLKEYLYKGRSVSIGGALKFETYINKEEKRVNKYKITVKPQQYAPFGDNKGTVKVNITRLSDEDLKTVMDLVSKLASQNNSSPSYTRPPRQTVETKPRAYDSPHQQAIANAEDDVPF